ncbi:tyrosinase-like [Anoplopoma fimbria]|uniref:tyrosinase-like n=1 Tax=Anoplopoma fimbria TaxID=229290 RepID=UPI0023EB19D6|nr:tyrosinase-like [Anoplopoma fimbria]
MALFVGLAQGEESVKNILKHARQVLWTTGRAGLAPSLIQHITCPYREGPDIICARSDTDSPAYLIRRPGSDPKYKTLPTTKDVEDTLATPECDTPPYDRTSRNSFRNKLEGFEIPNDTRHLNKSMHNLVHSYLSGTMSLLTTAANDPLFMVHHSFIDKLFEDWYQNHTSAKYPDSDDMNKSQREQELMAPFFHLRTNDYCWGKDTKDLGYRYREHSLHQP